MVRRRPIATTVPGLIIYRFDAAPLFFNADYFKQRVRAAAASAARHSEAVRLQR